MPFSGRICPIFGIPFDFSPLQSILELKRETNNFSEGADKMTRKDYVKFAEKSLVSKTPNLANFPPGWFVGFLRRITLISIAPDFTLRADWAQRRKSNGCNN
jgi:hypothetical protein